MGRDRLWPTGRMMLMFRGCKLQVEQGVAISHLRAYIHLACVHNACKALVSSCSRFGKATDREVHSFSQTRSWVRKAGHRCPFFASDTGAGICLKPYADLPKFSSQCSAYRPAMVVRTICIFQTRSISTLRCAVYLRGWV